MGKRQIFYDLDPEKIRFVVDPDSKNKHSGAFRIKIQYVFNGKQLPLILAPNGCKFYSFGMQKNQINTIDTGIYGMCLCISYKTKKSSEEDSPEEEFCAYIHTIYNECKKYLAKNRYKDEESLEQLFKSPLKEDIDSNNKNPDYHHFKIYPKMIMKKGERKIWTKFFDINNNEELDPWDFENVHVRVFPAILFDSIFVLPMGSFLQCKLSEAIIERTHDSDGRPGPSLNKSLLSTFDELKLENV